MTILDVSIRRATQLLHEVSQSSGTSAVLAAVASAGIGRRVVSPRGSLLMGTLAAGYLTWLHREAAHRLARDIRSAEDAAVLSASLGAVAPVFGRWAAEGDFAGMIVREMERSPELVVECGSGATSLVIAQRLQQNGFGRLLSFEHDTAYRARIERVLGLAGLGKVAQVVEAPLKQQQFGARTVDWYDRSVVELSIKTKIDVLVVDGPPQVSPWARWPALEVFHAHLAEDAVVLVDDGRTRRMTRAVHAWTERFSDLQLYWIDTVKGTWLLKRADGSEMHGALLRLARLINPRPAGFGRWPVHR